MDDDGIPDERTCPVCRQAANWNGAQVIRFPTFTAMMRHWEAAHPQAVPVGDQPHDNGRRQSAFGLQLQSIEPAVDIDAWIRDMEAHPQEMHNAWVTLGYGGHDGSTDQTDDTGRLQPAA